MEKKINYWLVSAERDWEVAGHLLEKRDYAYALFFGHLMGGGCAVCGREPRVATRHEHISKR